MTSSVDNPAVVGRIGGCERAGGGHHSGFAAAGGGAGAYPLHSRADGAEPQLPTAPQQLTLARRAVSYTLFLASAMRELGFNFGVLLGAAGIVTLAIGFASQTSVSNVISGLFMILERSVGVGDVIKVGSTTGEVIAIDLLSTKLRTFDNLLVRIPNETMIKAEITTLTRFPIRRSRRRIGVAYKDDLQQVEQVLLAVADRNPLSLQEPQPLLIARGFGESSIDYLLGVRVKRENFLELRNQIYREIKEAFDDAGIEIPFPQRSVHAGSTSEPLPVRLVAADEGPFDPPPPPPCPTAVLTMSDS